MESISSCYCWRNRLLLMSLFAVFVHYCLGDDFTYETRTSKVAGIMDSPDDVREGETFDFGYSPSGTPQSCEADCAAEDECVAYTFFAHDHPDRTWEGECVGRTGYTDVSEADYYATSGERLPSQSSTTIRTTTTTTTTTTVPTTTAPDAPLGYQISQRAEFTSSTGQDFTPQCTRIYGDEMRRKAGDMVPVVNARIGSDICEGKSLDDIEILLSSTSFLTSGAEGTTSLYWTASVGGSQNIGSVESCALEIAAFLSDHNNWESPILPDAPGCPGVAFAEPFFNTTEVSWRCPDTSSEMNERSASTESLDYGLILTGLLATEGNETITEECLVEFVRNLEDATLEQVVRANAFMGSTLCSGKAARLGMRSVNIAASGNKASTWQDFNIHSLDGLTFAEVYACADEVSAYLQSHDNWNQPIISSPAGCPNVMFSPPVFTEDSQRWICS